MAAPRTSRRWLALAGPVAAMLVAASAPPASAAFDSGSITYTGEKSVTCASGKFGYLYAAGNHVSYKKVYWKQNGVSHWSNTAWTGFNGGDVLVTILPKTGGQRTSRAYFGLARDSRHGMTAKSKLSWRLLCDSRDLSGFDQIPEAADYDPKQFWKKTSATAGKWTAR